MLSLGRLRLYLLLALCVIDVAWPLRAEAKALKATNSLAEIKHPLIYRPVSVKTPGASPYAPSDIWKAYDFLPLYSAGIYGNGTIIVIIDAYGDPKLSTDLSTFDSLTGLSPATVNTFYPNGHPTQQNSGWAVETALDVEWSHAVAPSATIDLVIAPNSSVGYIFDAISYVANTLTNATVVSMSFGQSESLYPATGPYTISATHQLFATMVSHGTSIFASSGDSGASTCCDASYPASDTLVVAVGGTTLSLNSSASYLAESAWSGSGAGSSIFFTKPAWQQGLGDSKRDEVDVSYDADPNTGVLVVQNGSNLQVGGTSAGSPQWAGLAALASQASDLRYGSIASRLYALSGQSSYHDVTTGSDGYFSAGPGWDYPTGIGTPDANLLVSGLLGPAAPVRSSIIFQGLNVTVSGNLQVNNSTSTVSGIISVETSNATTGGLVLARNYTLVNVNLRNGMVGREFRFLLNIPLSPQPLSADIILTIQGNNASTQTIVTRRINISGGVTVNIVDVVLVMSDFNAVQGSPSYNPAADLAAKGMVDIVDATIAESFYNAPVFY